MQMQHLNKLVASSTNLQSTSGTFDLDFSNLEMLGIIRCHTQAEHAVSVIASIAAGEQTGQECRLSVSEALCLCCRSLKKNLEW